MNENYLNEVAIPRSRPDVAVIVPCYNYGRFLRGCVNSILKYTYLEVCVIIIDDCSTDETPNVCMELSRENTRIQIVRHKNNLGHIVTYNHGLDLADADYLHLISADDELTPFALDRSVAIMRRHPDVGMVYGRVNLLSSHPSLRIPKRPTYSIVQGIDWIEARCRDGRNPIYSPEVTLRSMTAYAAGAYNPRLPLMGDLEMWLRVAARSNVAILENCDQALYRIHQQSMHLAHMKEGLIRCLQERAEAFETFFDGHGYLLPNSKLLFDLARSKVISDALRRTRLAFDQGHVNMDDLIIALEFAQKITLKVDQFPEWRLIQDRLAKGFWPSLRRKVFDRFIARFSEWWEWQQKNRNLGYEGVRVIYSGRLL